MRGVAGLLPGRRRRTAEDERSAAEVISAVPEREFPYGRQPECGPDTNAFRRLGVTFTPHPAPATMPIPVPEAPDEVTVLAKVLDGLQNLDWEALDAARDRESLDYAHTTGAPFHNALLAAWRSPVRPARRHGEAVQRRAEALRYPPLDITAAAGHGAYAKVMEHANRITGTLGTGRFRPALPSAGAR